MDAHAPAPSTNRAVRKMARNCGSLPAQAVSMMDPTSIVVDASLWIGADRGQGRRVKGSSIEYDV